MADFNKLLSQIDDTESCNPSHRNRIDDIRTRDGISDVSSSLTKSDGFRVGNGYDADASHVSTMAVFNTIADINHGSIDDDRKVGTDTTKYFVSDTGDDESSGLDLEYETLKRLWIQEINSPEILVCDFETVSILLEMLSEQEMTIEKLQNKEKKKDHHFSPELASLASSICKMDADRLRFLLTDLTRSRMVKLEKYALYNRYVLDRLDDHEISYLRQYGELFEKHMRRSVTDLLPKDAWKKLDDPEMVDRPDLDVYVFCIVLEDVQIDNRKGITIDDNGEDDDEGAIQVQYYKVGSTLFLRYAVIQDFVQDGKVELLM